MHSNWMEIFYNIPYYDHVLRGLTHCDLEKKQIDTFTKMQ